MSTPSRCLLATLLSAHAALLSSCTYEPYAYGPPPHTSVSSSVTYRSGGHVSSSLLIRTSSSRWAYDPHCHSYYDYTTRCYYDPWLQGYYPLGYRPPVIIGAPHPHGWRPGLSHCPPPIHVRQHRIQNYHNRHLHYQKLNHSWAKHVRSSNAGGPHPGNHISHGLHSRSGLTNLPNRPPVNGHHQTTGFPYRSPGQHATAGQGWSKPTRPGNHPGAVQPGRPSSGFPPDRFTQERNGRQHQTGAATKQHAPRQFTPPSLAGGPNRGQQSMRTPAGLPAVSSQRGGGASNPGAQPTPSRPIAPPAPQRTLRQTRPSPEAIAAALAKRDQIRHAISQSR